MVGNPNAIVASCSDPIRDSRRSLRELHRDTEPTGGTGGEGEGSVVRLHDALGDREAEADAGVIAANALGAALERLREGGDDLRNSATPPCSRLARRPRRRSTPRWPYRPPCRPSLQVVHDRRCARDSPSVAAGARGSRERRPRSPDGIDPDAALLSEGEEHLDRSLFGDERQVDGAPARTHVRRRG